MAPTLLEWKSEIVPAVYISVMLGMAIIDIPLLCGLLISKKSKRQLSSWTVVNFIFVSFLAIGWMCGSTHHGMTQYEDGKVPYNCDLLTVTYKILQVLAPTTLLTVALSKMVEILLAPYEKSEYSDLNEKAPIVKLIWTFLCIALPWIYSLVINVAIINHDATNDIHDCYVNTSATDLHTLWRVGYFLPAAISCVVCILCLAFFLMLPHDVTKPSIGPYVLAVFVSLGLMFAEFYFYTTKCIDYSSVGFPGCFLSREDDRLYGQPAKISYCLAFLLFPLILFLSKPIRSSYCLAWSRLCRLCQKKAPKGRKNDVKNRNKPQVPVMESYAYPNMAYDPRFTSGLSELVPVAVPNAGDMPKAEELELAKDGPAHSDKHRDVVAHHPGFPHHVPYLPPPPEMSMVHDPRFAGAGPPIQWFPVYNNRPPM